LVGFDGEPSYAFPPVQIRQETLLCFRLLQQSVDAAENHVGLNDFTGGRENSEQLLLRAQWLSRM
jgi:hypothetical protein